MCSERSCRRARKACRPAPSAPALGIPSATLSFHLKELKSSGLVRCDRQGRSRIYSPDFCAMSELIAFLTANCCRGVDGSAPTRDGCDIAGGAGC
jgi:DNA-binding transcriptional ArsR family regulator